MAHSREIDLAGLKCPMPIVKLNKVIKELAGGEELCAIADDPAFRLDIQAWCKKTGHALVSLQQVDGKLVAVIQKTAA